MTTDTALALLRDAAGNLYMAYNAFTRNDAIAWEPLKETADRITALLDSAIKDAGDDVVEPDIVQAYRRGYGYDRVLNYIDSLQSALQVAQQERDAAKKQVLDYGGLWDLSEYKSRAEKAEASNKRLVELLRAAEPDVSEIYERMQAEGWHRKERMEFQTKLIADIAELLRAAGK